MAFASRMSFETLRSLAFGSISGSYAAVGTPLAHPTRQLIFTNNTAGDLLVSDDGVNDKLFVKAGSYILLDVDCNRDGGENQQFKAATGTQYYVKQSTAPTSGAFYITAIYAQGE